MVSLWAALGVAAVVLLGEWLHGRRIRQVARLAFGPSGRPAAWVRLVPASRVLGWGAITWSLVTLWQLEPKVHESETVAPEDYRHVVLVLDVSPSMRLQDAGPTGDQSRMQRASSVMESFFKRVAIQQYKMSVIAVYNGAKPVVVDTSDVAVVRNILNDLPMHYAFTAGKTDLFAGLREAAQVARPWRPQSTTLIVISDGDTVPAMGMPTMPASVRDVVVVGVGDPVSGKFIDGQQSRQDASMLRQVATRLGGTYHNGNEHHLSSELLSRLTATTESSPLERLTLRDYALLVLAIASGWLAALPLLLTYAGVTRPWSRAVVGRQQANWMGARSAQVERNRKTRVPRPRREVASENEEVRAGF